MNKAVVRLFGFEVCKQNEKALDLGFHSSNHDYNSIEARVVYWILYNSN